MIIFQFCFVQLTLGKRKMVPTFKILESDGKSPHLDNTPAKPYTTATDNLKFRL